MKGEELYDEVFEEDGEQGDDPNDWEDQAEAGNDTDWECGARKLESKLENNDFCFSSFSIAVVISTSAAKEE